MRIGVGSDRSIAAKIGCTAKTLLRWARQQERDTGERLGPTTAKEQRIKVLEREVRELRKANEILCLVSAFFVPNRACQPLQAVRAFIDQNRHPYGVEPICR